MPLATLLFLEVALRIAGYGYSTPFWVHHAATGPGLLVENQRFSWRFFPRQLARHPEPLLTTPTKPPGVYRILILGESAAQGDPAPAFGVSRILHVLLTHRYPNMEFKTLNTAFTAINSHVITEIARDSRRLQANAWLVYMGHNEVVGPFGTGTVFGNQSPPRSLIRAQLAFKKTRAGQWLGNLLENLHSSPDAAQGWGGMTMFLNHQVTRDDPRLNRTQLHFERNLQDIVNLGLESGAQVIVSTMVSRLRDWAPFASLHRPDLTQAQLQEWTRLYQEAITAETASNSIQALDFYAQAAQIDDSFAELHYRWGRCHLDINQPQPAQGHFVLARDLDTLRFRTDTRLNESIRQIATRNTDPNLALIDAEHAFNQLSIHGSPGSEWLHEHVHFNFTGNYHLARLFAESLAARLPSDVLSESKTGPDWLTEDECAARLAYTDTQRHEIATLVQRRLEEPIYQHQLDHPEHLTQIREELFARRGAAKPAAQHRALEACRQALVYAPDDWRIHDLAARLFTRLGDDPAAIAEWRLVSQLIPHAPGPSTELGKLLLRQPDPHGAIAAFEQAIAVNPDSAEAHVGLGHCHLQLGATSDAARSFRRALELDPTRGDAILALDKLRSGDRFE